MDICMRENGKKIYMIVNKIVTLFRNLNYLSKHSLWDNRESDIVYLTNKILDDSIYEFNLSPDGYNKIHVLTKEESMDLIFNENKSFVRTGDGECRLLMGEDQPFQKCETAIIDGLKKILKNDTPNLLVGVNGNYFSPLYKINNPFFYRRNGYDLRSVYSKFINLDKIYFHSAITGYQFGQEFSNECKYQYERWRNAFINKDIVVVCGEGILDKLQYDVFELARTKRIIYGPRINAWDKHDELISKIVNEVEKKCLIVFILGMAGKVMNLELTEKGYICWDVGHLAKFYDAFKKRKVMTDLDKKNFYAPD